MSTAVKTVNTTKVNSVKVNTATVNNQDYTLKFAETICQITNTLRGSTNAAFFYKYVVSLFFYRFISENLTYYVNKQINENLTYYQNGDNGCPELANYLKKHKCFDYTKLPNEIAILGRSNIVFFKKGFFILPNQLFSNVLARAKNGSNLNETILAIFGYINSCSFMYSQSILVDDGKLLPELFDVKNLDFLGLYKTTREKNQKLKEVMNAVAKIPLNSFIKKTINYKIETILEWEEELSNNVREILFN